MKKILLISLIVFITIGCGRTASSSPPTPTAQVVEEPVPQLPDSAIAIWNGTADTTWYIESQSEFSLNTAEQLAGLAKLVNDGNKFTGKTIKLESHIKLNDMKNWPDWDDKPPANKWNSIGTLKNPFNGTFDGNGYIIIGVYIYKPENGAQNQGLFGSIDFEGTIKNLGVFAVWAVEEEINAIGGLAGVNSGTISNSFSHGFFIIGRYHISGFVGANGGVISNCYSIGRVAGDRAVGGLVGLNIGKISNSFSASAVIAFEGPDAGGLVGVHHRGDISNSYYDKTDSGDRDKQAKGMTKEEMKQKDTFEGWDFDNIWAISKDRNYGYPHLRIIKPPPLTATD